MNMHILELLQEINNSEHLDLKLKEVDLPNKNTDLVIQINNEKVYIETKYEVRPIQVPQIREQASLFKREAFLIASRYITPTAKELLKKYRINYLDAAGNAHMKLGGILIHIEGNKAKPPSENYKNRAFTKVGAKLIYTLLRNPESINLTYRRLSEISTCSLGSVSKIIDHLKEEKFIITLPGKKLKLVQQELLINKWIDVLSKQLLPYALIGRYDFAGRRKWYEINLKDGKEYSWGSEPAASILTQKNFIPQEYSIYTSKKPSEVVKDLKLTPSADGALKVYQKFWSDASMEKYAPTVDPLLVYAELIASKDSRNIEIATEIKEKFLHGKF
jgi:hypothetical protein